MQIYEQNKNSSLKGRKWSRKWRARHRIMAYKDRKDFEVMSLAAATAKVAHIKKEIWTEAQQHVSKSSLSFYPCFPVLVAMDQIPFWLKGISLAGDAAQSFHNVFLTKPTQLVPFLTLYLKLHFESVTYLSFPQLFHRAIPDLRNIWARLAGLCVKHYGHQTQRCEVTKSCHSEHKSQIQIWPL